MIHLERISVVFLVYFTLRPFIRDRKKYNNYFFTIWGIGIMIQLLYTFYIYHTVIKK